MTEIEHTKINVAVIGGDRSVARTLKAHIDLLHELEQYRAIGLTPEQIEAMQGHNIALINDLGEYQSIGTIDEFKALKEKNEPKKVDEEYCCPICHTCGMDDDGIAGAYCTDCGQKLDWSE